MEEPPTNRRRDDFIDIVKKELAERPASASDLARDDLLFIANSMQHLNAGRRRRFRDGLVQIANERGFDATTRGARFLVTVWRERADELESVFHRIIDAMVSSRLRVSSESLASRTRRARDQMQTTLREATVSPTHRIVELRLSIELCVETLGYDASFIEASRLTNDLRSDANDLEAAVCEIMFDDLCARLGQHGQATFRRAA